MPTISEALTERAHTLTAALYKGSLSAVAASLPPLAEALAPAAAEHWGLVKTLGRNIGHTMEELTDMGFALDALDKMVASKSKEIRAAACWALAEIGAERPDNVSGLAYRLAKDEAWEVRDQIAAAYDERIGPAQPRSLFELMRRWSNDSDERVRRTPALSLIRRARRDRVPVLAILEVLRRDSSTYVRKGVVYCLQQAWGRAENPNYGPLTPDSPSFLLRILRDWARDASPNTRWVVAYTLAHTWVAPYLAEALAILRMVARDPNEQVQKAVVAALLGLRKLGNPLLRRTLEAWAAETFEPTVSQLARRVLAEIPTEEVVAPPLAAPANPPRPTPAPTNNQRGANHRQRRHSQAHPPSATANQAGNGSALTPPTRAEAIVVPIVESTPSAEARVAPPIEAVTSAQATAPAEASAPRKRGRRPQAEATRTYVVAAPVVEAPAPEASASPPTPKKRTSKSKAEAAPDVQAAANSDAATPASKKRRANSALSTQHSALKGEEAANG
jgi:3-methyladenine DNA glycosylase AlkD